MQSVTFLIPGDLDSRTGGYGYDRRIINELRHLGWRVDVGQLDRSFPFPTAAALAQAADALARLEDGALAVVDGLAFGAMADQAERERDRLRLVALVHHPLANETGIDQVSAEQFVISERRALACARLVFVTSRATIRSLTPLNVPREKVAVVEPGTDPGPVAHGSGTSTPNLLCVASVTPRKGYEVLIRALSSLADEPWQLTCVGSLDRAPDTAARVRALVSQYGLVDRVRFVGELGEEDVSAAYADADLFVLPTFHEGYGMVVAEAIARGLPVISTPTGAIGDLVGEKAGMLVPAADVAALTTALRAVLTDASLRSRLREGALEMREKLPSWRQSAATMADALASVRGVRL